jgi:hypothetical protein
MWAYVENNVVVEEHVNLPANWRNFSNFFALEDNPEFLKSLNWYELVDDTQPITNDFVQYHGDLQYTIDHDLALVRKNKPILVRDNPVSEEERRTQHRQSFFRSLREERKTRLQESDWTQSFDLQNTKNYEWRQAWAEYRQALRDLPQVYEQDQYRDMLDLDAVHWPPIPEND